MDKNITLQLLKMYSLTYSEILKECRAKDTYKFYFTKLHSDYGLIKIDYRNKEFIIRQNLDIISRSISPEPESVEINGTLCWKDNYREKWFILKEKVFIYLFGTEKLSIEP